MFLISERTPSGFRFYVKNDIKDIGELILNITGKESESSKAMIAAGEMGFGGMYESCFYRIECLREEVLRKMRLIK